MYYTKTHEWLKPIGGNLARIGISKQGIEELGTIEFMELPAIGTSIKHEAPFAQIESTKVSSDLYAPVSGEVTEVNAELSSEIHLLNSDPEGAGWLAVIRLDSLESLATLMTEESYKQYIAGET